MAGVSFNVTAQEAAAVAAFENVTQAEGKVESGAQRMGAAWKSAERQQRELERAAKQFYDRTRTPQERHNRNLDRLGKLLAKDKNFRNTSAV